MQKSKNQLHFISISSLSLLASGISLGRRPRRGKGNNELRLQRIINVAKLSKLSLVIPKSWVRPAPISPPTTLPPFDIDISVAKSVASIPSGHNLAANTRTGMKEACNKFTIRFILESAGSICKTRDKTVFFFFLLIIWREKRRRNYNVNPSSLLYVRNWSLKFEASTIGPSSFNTKLY